MEVPALSLCIATSESWTSLQENIRKYLDNPFIQEIIITDDTGSDAAHIMETFPDQPKLSVHVNDRPLLAFKNKEAAVAHATNPWVCLVEPTSDVPLAFFEAWFIYLSKVNSEFVNNRRVIFTPEKWLETDTDNRNLLNVVIDKTNVAMLMDLSPAITALLSNGHHIFQKTVYLEAISEKLYFDDADVFCKNLFLLEKGAKYVIVPNMHYSARETAIKSIDLRRQIENLYKTSFAISEAKSVQSMYVKARDLNILEKAGWSTLYYGIFTDIVKQNKYKNVAEIGAGYGTHSRHILDQTDVEKLYIVDPMKFYTNDAFASDVLAAESFTYVDQNFNKLFTLINNDLLMWKHRYTWLRKKSIEVKEEEIPDGSLDAVFIDGNHEYVFVLADLRKYWKKLRSGGQLLGDDYWMTGVSRAVNDFSGEIGVRFDLLTKPGQSHQIYRFHK